MQRKPVAVPQPVSSWQSVTEPVDPLSRSTLSIVSEQNLRMALTMTTQDERFSIEGVDLLSAIAYDTVQFMNQIYIRSALQAIQEANAQKAEGAGNE